MGAMCNKAVSKTNAIDSNGIVFKVHQTNHSQLKEIETTSSFEDIKKVYMIKAKAIGNGHFGVVRVGSLRNNPEKMFAIKTMEKQKLSKDLQILDRELRILMSLDHPNIVKFYETYQDQKYFHLVMEYCSGGELIERITEAGRLSENEAGKIIFKLLIALNYLHDNQICHRDIKPENFLFADKSPSAEIKIIDFGLSKHIDEPEDGKDIENDNSELNTKKLSTIVGTPLYVAPEVLRGKYDFKCDLWSLGVVLYIILSGYPPFYGKDKKEIFFKVMNGKYDMEGAEWVPISIDCKRFITRLLEIDPKKRYSASSALHDKWIKLVQNDQKKTLKKIDPSIINKLEHFHYSTKLKKEVLRIMVNMMSEKDIQGLKEAFLAIDTNNKGTISFEELKQVMNSLGHKHTEAELLNIMNTFHEKKVDTPINYSEFITATLDKKYFLSKERLFQAFKYFDVDNSNFITLESLEEAMARGGKKIDSKELKSWIKEVDFLNEGRISFEEFRIMMEREDLEDIDPSLTPKIQKEEH